MTILKRTLIKLYYAAFFAAHSHMRSCGYSSLNLDAVDAARIYETASLYGVSNATTKLSSGLYSLVFDPASAEIRFRTASSKGSHKTLWFLYNRFLIDLEARSKSEIAIKDERDVFVARLQSIRKVLCLNGSNGGNWLSRFRNILQYRQGYGAWHPHSLSKSVSRSLYDKVITGFSSIPDDIDLPSAAISNEDEVKAFFYCTVFLCSFTRAAALEMSDRSTVKRSTSRQGAANFLKMMKLG